MTKAPKVPKGPKKPPVVRALVPQPHGGALRPGNPGNRGRAASIFREEMLVEDAPKAKAFLQSVLSGEPLVEMIFRCQKCQAETIHKVSGDIDQRLNAAEKVLKYSVGPADQSTHLADLTTKVREVLRAQLFYLAEALKGSPLQEPIITKLEELWGVLEQ